MAWSPSFYPSLNGVRERALVLGERISYGYSNPQSPQNGGAIQAQTATATSSRQLFDKLFPEPPGGGARQPIVDRVFESYSGCGRATGGCPPRTGVGWTSTCSGSPSCSAGSRR
jgi:hypothetical protein